MASLQRSSEISSFHRSLHRTAELSASRRITHTQTISIAHVGTSWMDSTFTKTEKSVSFTCQPAQNGGGITRRTSHDIHYTSSTIIAFISSIAFDLTGRDGRIMDETQDTSERTLSHLNIQLTSRFPSVGDLGSLFSIDWRFWISPTETELLHACMDTPIAFFFLSVFLLLISHLVNIVREAWPEYIVSFLSCFSCNGAFSHYCRSLDIRM